MLGPSIPIAKVTLPSRHIAEVHVGMVTHEGMDGPLAAAHDSMSLSVSHNKGYESEQTENLSDSAEVSEYS